MGREGRGTIPSLNLICRALLGDVKKNKPGAYPRGLIWNILVKALAAVPTPKAAAQSCRTEIVCWISSLSHETVLRTTVAIFAEGPRSGD